MKGEVRQASYTRVRKQGWPLVYSKEILHVLLCASLDKFEVKSILTTVLVGESRF